MLDMQKISFGLLLAFLFGITFATGAKLVPAYFGTVHEDSSGGRWIELK